MTAVWVAKAVALSFAAKALSALLGRLGSDDDSKLFDGDPTLARRGAQLNLLIGRDELSPLVMSLHNREVRLEQNSARGGKGVGAGGGLDNEVLYEHGAHGIAVGGSVIRLRTIKQNGEVIWPKQGEYPNGITPLTAPSGSEFDTESEDGYEGDFRIYWGGIDQPIDPEFVSYLPIRTALPYVMWVYWCPKRVGGSETWGQLTYDVECAPFIPGLSDGDDYFAATPELEDSASWFRNGKSADEATAKAVYTYDENTGTIKCQGPLTFAADDEIALRYPGIDPQLGVVSSASYNPTETITIPTALYPVRVMNPDVTSWFTQAGSPAPVVDITSSTTIPGIMVGTAFNVLAFEVGNVTGQFEVWQRPSVGGIVPTGAIDESDAGDGFLLSAFYVLNDLSPSDVPYTFQFAHRRPGLAPGVFQPKALLAFTLLPNNQVQFQNNFSEGALFVQVNHKGGGWWEVEFRTQVGAGNELRNDEDLFVWFSTPSGTSGVSTLYRKLTIAVARDDDFSLPLLAQSVGTTITGVQTIVTDLNLASLEPFLGTVVKMVADVNGIAGANAAHIIYQLMFAKDPHGLGMDTSVWDIDSLELVGAQLESEGIRSHVKLNGRKPIKDALNELMLDVGLEVYWDAIARRFAFKLRRAEEAQFKIPRELLAEELPRTVSRLSGSFTPRQLGYTYRDAEFDYSIGSFDVNEDGKVEFADSEGTDTREMVSVRDRGAGEQVAAIRVGAEIPGLEATSVRLLRDAIVLHPGDVIDLFPILRQEGTTHRVLSVQYRHGSPDVELTVMPSFYEIEEVPELRATAGGARDTTIEVVPQDVAVVADESEGGVMVLRVPGHPKALMALVQASVNGTGYWTLGPAPPTPGGRVIGTYVESSETRILFRAPVPSVVDGMPSFPPNAEGQGLLKGRDTQGNTYLPLRVTPRGGDLFELAMTDPPTTPVVAGDYVFVWASGSIPIFKDRLPVAPTRKYSTQALRPKVVQVAPVEVLPDV